MTDDGSRISVSRDALRADLADLELRLIKTLVTKSEYDGLVQRVGMIESVGSPHVQEIGKQLAAITESLNGKADVQDLATAQAQVDANTNWRNRIIGGLILLALVVSAGVPIIAQHYFH